MSTPPRKPLADLSSLKIDDHARKSGNWGKRLGWLAIILVMLMAGAGAVYRFKDSKAVVEVTTARSAANAPEAALLNASGYVTPRRRSSVAAKITGRVIEVDTDEGMSIKEGQIIARLDCSEFDAALASAKADRLATQSAVNDLQVNLANAERELERTKKLTAAGVSTPQALDAAQTLTESYRARIALTKDQVAAADRRIDVAQENVNNCTIRAPFSGQVVSKDAQVGEMVSPISAGGGFTRTGIATIVDMQSLEIEVDVNESYIARVKPRQRVSATLDAYPNWQIPSHVRTVIPTADRQKATVKVRITFDKLDPRILPDMGVKVAFLGEEQPRAAAGSAAAAAKALIPSSAVRQQDGRAAVFLVHDTVVERRAVTLGSQHGDDVEVLAGVAEGDTIVAKVPENLRDGQTVEVKK
ncbi:MAG: efflux RND transporter periplasmic adaptor subunit [Acidobacteriia bacterium]|nr:efflux RND transporter periplasmic adaptor subunit [Terriglobia bacterium]